MKTEAWANRTAARKLLHPFAGYTHTLDTTLKQDFELHCLEVQHRPAPVRGELKVQNNQIVPTSTGLLQ